MEIKRTVRFRFTVQEDVREHVEFAETIERLRGRNFERWRYIANVIELGVRAMKNGDGTSGQAAVVPRKQASSEGEAQVAGERREKPVASAVQKRPSGNLRSLVPAVKI